MRRFTTTPRFRSRRKSSRLRRAGIRLARTAYLPRVDALAQVNRATRNNVFGMLLPQSVIPSMSGPVIGTNNFGTAWGSASGALVTWEPFDFGLRRASVAAAEAARAQSDAALERTQYEVAVAAADAYLTLAAAQETVEAAQAGGRARRNRRAHHHGVGECRTASWRGRDRAPKPKPPPPARSLSRRSRPWRSAARRSPSSWAWTPARCRLRLPGSPPPRRAALSRARYGRQPHRRRTERRYRTGQGATSRARALLFPTLLPAGLGVCAWNRRGNQRRDSGRRERPGPQHAELCPRLHRQLPGDGLRRAARPRGGAIGQHPRRGGARPPDRRGSAGPV